MKKLVNDPRRIVPEMLEGQVGLNPGLTMLEGMTVVLRTDAPIPGRVALISERGTNRPTPGMSARGC